MEKQAIKEGSRIGQSIASIYKLGGLSYFCYTTQIPNGDERLLDNVLVGINNDKKAKELSKIILSYNDDNKEVIGKAHMPNINSPITLNKWIDHLLNECAIKRNIKIEYNKDSITTEKFKLVIDGNQEYFPFKICDDIINENHSFLKKNNLLPLKEEDIDIDYASCMGIEW